VNAATLSGQVTQFDPIIGLGVVESANGESFPFHCLSIADGTRTIPVGCSVSFGLSHRFGRDEAVAIIG
jgi:cold shock CspA family protein